MFRLRALINGYTVPVLVAAVFLLAAGISVWSGARLRYPDERDYHGLALRLVAGQGFVDEQAHPTALRPPGYPFLLAGIYSVWAHPLAAKLVNALACALTALVLSRLAARMGNQAAGRLAPALVLAYPLFAYTASTLYPQTIGTLLLVSTIFLLSRTPLSWRATALAGVFFGCLMLAIPSFLMLLPLFGGYLLVSGRPAGGSWFWRAVLFSAAAVLVVAPWTIRNYARFHSCVPISANGGLNLLIGNSPTTTPQSGVNVDLSEYEQQAAGMNDVEKDQLFQRCAIACVKAHPGAALKLYCWKVAGYFSCCNQLFVKAESSRSRDIILFLTYYPLLALAVVRLSLWRRFKFDRVEAFLFLLYFGNAFLSAIFFTRIRFRVPFDALLILLVAVFLGRLWAESSRLQSPTPGNRE